MAPIPPRSMAACTLATIGMLLHPQALSQALEQPSLDITLSDPDEPQPHILDEITITARPLNQALEVNVGAFGARDPMEIPLSVQRYDSRHIRDAASRTAMDALTNDPSLSSASLGGSFDSFRLRGFRMDNFHSIRREGIAVLPYHDEALEHIERIDVLKGPSGFLYGFNSPGGTLNYILKRPTQKPFTHLTAQASSLAGRYTSIDTSQTHLNGAFGWRLNAAYDKTGDFNHTADQERKFASISTDLRLNSQSLLQMNADWYSKRVMADPLLRADQSSRNNPLDPSTFVLPPRVDRRHLLAPSWWRYQTRTRNLDTKFEYRINATWVSVTQLSYSLLDGGEIFTDYFDIQPDGAIGHADLYAFRQERFSNRAFQTHLAGKFLAHELHHDLFMGMSSRELRGRTPKSDLLESNEDLPVARISVGNVLFPADPPPWEFGPPNPITFRMNIRERSIFASDLISMNDQLQLLLGGRYIWYQADDLQEGAIPQRKNVLVPAGALIYRPIEPLMSYLSYSRGFEAGEYAPYNANNANAPTNAIESRQIEIGIKADLRPNLELSAALFSIRRDATYLNLANDFVSDGHFLHQGLEMNLNGRPTKDFDLFGNIAFLDTALKGVTDMSTLNKRSEGVPRWKGTLGGRYTARGISGLSIDSTFNYVGKRPVDAQNSGFIPGYLVWDAGLTFQTRTLGHATTLRINGKNLANKYYYRGVNYLGGLEVGRGREVFLSMSVKF